MKNTKTYIPDAPIYFHNENMHDYMFMLIRLKHSGRQETIKRLHKLKGHSLIVVSHNQEDNTLTVKMRPNSKVYTFPCYIFRDQITEKKEENIFKKFIPQEEKTFCIPQKYKKYKKHLLPV